MSTWFGRRQACAHLAVPSARTPRPSVVVCMCRAWRAHHTQTQTDGHKHKRTQFSHRARRQPAEHILPPSSHAWPSSPVRGLRWRGTLADFGNHVPATPPRLQLHGHFMRFESRSSRFDWRARFKVRQQRMQQAHGGLAAAGSLCAAPSTFLLSQQKGTVLALDFPNQECVGDALSTLYSLFSVVFLSPAVCVAPKLRSLHFAHPVYVASRYFQ